MLFAEAAAQGPARWLGWLKALVFHPGKLNLISGVHVEGGENIFHKASLSPPHVCCGICVLSPTSYTHTHNKNKLRCSGSRLSILLLGFVFTTFRTLSELLATVPLKKSRMDLLFYNLPFSCTTVL